MLPYSTPSNKAVNTECSECVWTGVEVTVCLQTYQMHSADSSLKHINSWLVCLMRAACSTWHTEPVLNLAQQMQFSLSWMKFLGTKEGLCQRTATVRSSLRNQRRGLTVSAARSHTLLAEVRARSIAVFTDNSWREVRSRGSYRFNAWSRLEERNTHRVQ